MAKLLDQILVIDIESTCWQGYPPPGQSSEIIEVGLCPVEVRKLERLEKRSLLIKPVRSRISEFCTKLTTLSDEHFQTAGTLADAVGILKKEYRSPDRLWASSAEGVQVYRGDGVHIGRVRVPEMVANLAFGGARRNRLFICGTTSLYAVYLKING